LALLVQFAIYTPILKTNFYIHLSYKTIVFFVSNYGSRNLLFQEIDYIFLGSLFIIMCLTNYKNIGDIYYPRNCENLYNKANNILVEKGLLKKSILIFF